MGVPLEGIAVGKCFLTELGQVRRVLSVRDGIVTYESRGKTAHGGSWGSITTRGIAHFARTVDREVPCDHDPYLKA
jgi:hypothetical protein